MIPIKYLIGILILGILGAGAFSLKSHRHTNSRIPYLAAGVLSPGKINHQTINLEIFTRNIVDTSAVPSAVQVFNQDGLVTTGTTDLNGYLLIQNIPTAVNSEPGTNRPLAYRLGQNYPNPFGPHTTIPISTPLPAKLIVYNIRGQTVTEFDVAPEATEVRLNTAHWTSGVYFCRLSTEKGELLKTQKMAHVAGAGSTGTIFTTQPNNTALNKPPEYNHQLGSEDIAVWTKSLPNDAFGTKDTLLQVTSHTAIITYSVPYPRVEYTTLTQDTVLSRHTDSLHIKAALLGLGKVTAKFSIEDDEENSIPFGEQDYDAATTFEAMIAVGVLPSGRYRAIITAQQKIHDETYAKEFSTQWITIDNTWSVLLKTLFPDSSTASVNVTVSRDGKEVYTGSTDSNGVAEITLNPGLYSISFTSSNTADTTIQVEITADTTLDVLLREIVNFSQTVLNLDEGSEFALDPLNYVTSPSGIAHAYV